MRISWLSAEEIAAARQALTAGGASWDDHFAPEFESPAGPGGHPRSLDWERITEHVARAERVSQVVREHGLEAARRAVRGVRRRDRGRDARRGRPPGRQARPRSGDPGPALRHRQLRVLRAVPRADDRRSGKRRARSHGSRLRGLRRRLRRARCARSRTARRRSARCATGSPTSTSRAGRIDKAEALFERRHEEDRRRRRGRADRLARVPRRRLDQPRGALARHRRRPRPDRSAATSSRGACARSRKPCASA